MAPKDQHLCLNQKNKTHLRNWSDVQSEVWTTLVTKKMSMFTNSSIFYCLIIIIYKDYEVCVLYDTETLEMKSA